MTTPTTPSPAPSPPPASSWVALWLSGALAIIALAGAAVVLRNPPATAGTQAPAEPAGPARLSARLTLFAAGPGDDHAAVVRFYDARARLREAARQAAAGTRPWNGAIDEAAAAAPPVSAPAMALEAWQGAVMVETIDASGATARLQDGAVAVVRAPGAALDLSAGGSGQIVLLVASAALPAPGTLLRVRIATEQFETASTPVPVPEFPVAGPGGLAASARAADLLGRHDIVAARAASLVAADGAAPTGYYYRGVALEARGDRPGAIAAYEAALARTPEGPEPPIGITARLARLR